MRTVFANSDVAWHWFRQSQSRGRSHNGNFSFEGTKLYSYSTCIADIHRAVDGSKIVLMTSHTYSATTSSRHMPNARRACSYNYFSVPSVALGYADAHNDNVRHLISQYTDRVMRAKRQFSQIGDEWEGEILKDAADEVGSYCSAFGLPHTTLDWQADRDMIIAVHAKRRAWSQSPRGVKSRAYNALYRSWLALKDRKNYWASINDEARDDDTRYGIDEVSMMSWWVMCSGRSDDLDIIKWRFRRPDND